MALIDISNSSDGWLVVWLEPLGEDRWLKPGERFSVSNDYVGPKSAFQVDFWASANDRAAGIGNLNLWVNHGGIYAEFRDKSSAVVECGHQRQEKAP